MAVCESIQRNLDRCNCTYDPCERKGNCCECLHYHLRQNQLPACAFPNNVEKTWDRSFARFVACRGE